MADPPRNGTRWQLWVSAFVGGLAIVGFFGTLVYQVMNIYLTVNAQAVQLVDIRRDKEIMQGQISELRSRVERQSEALNEVETQFCASDSRSNLTHANDLRIFSMLWEKVYGTRYPTDNAYYPVVCNRRATR